MQKICVVIGTRPEAIKMAPVILALKQRPEEFNLTVISTGQHKTMLHTALATFGLAPDFDLIVMKPGQTLAQLTSSILLALEKQFALISPDLVLVHGDTTSAMVGAMAAFYLQIDVGHVEAGLRTRNLKSPFPEEYNRRSVAIVSRYHFAPTSKARDNLILEGVEQGRIIVTGNTVIDALLITIENLEKNQHELKNISENLYRKLKFEITNNIYILITAHRRENLGVGLENICNSVRKLAFDNPNIYFVFPVHPNPNVLNIVEAKLKNIRNIVLIPPQEYKEFAWLLKNCKLVLTDSGGIQEEAPALGKPVLVMRDTSERPEAIEAGTAKLVNTEPENVISQTQRLLTDSSAYNEMARAINPYGDGKAADRITLFLTNEAKS